MCFPASTNGAGMCMAFPDVCLTPAPPAPPIPIPYPNITQMTAIDGSTASSKVMICGKKTATVQTETTNSSGDEPGSVGGVVSGTFAQGGKYLMGSLQVMVEGKMCAHLISMMGQNNTANNNMPAGLQVVPSQVQVLVSP